MKLSIDLLAGLSALLFAILTLSLLPVLREVVSPEAATAFGLGALTRWYLAMRGDA